MRLDDAPVAGRIDAMPDRLDLAFWDGLARGELLIQRCTGCGTWIWPPQWLCRNCHRFDPEWERVPMTGHIYTWTRTWQAFAPELADTIPYVTALIELSHAGGRRLLGILVGDDDEDPRIGQGVEGVIQPASQRTNGVAILRWRPVGS